MATATRSRRRRVCAIIGVALALGVIVPYGTGRLTAEARRITVETTAVPAAPPSPSTLRVVAWNIAHGRGNTDSNLRRETDAARHARLRSIGDALTTWSADLVVLNEIDFDAFWSGGVDQVAVLTAHSPAHMVVRQRNVDVRLPFVTLIYGNAILSRYPILDVRAIDLPPASRTRDWLIGAKDAVRITVDPGGSTPVALYAVHLHPSDHAVRAASMRALLTDAEALSCPAIIAGDLNATAEAPDDAVQLLRAAGWSVMPPGAVALPSFPADAPTRAIDWIAVSPGLTLTETDVPAIVLSDHRPVVATIQLEPSSE